MRNTILLFLLFGLISCFNQKQKNDNKRPQTPLPPFPYKVEDVSYFNQEKSVEFGGTLTVPQMGAKHPVAILITGSGQQDRDETIFGHKPFLVIADYLTRNGIAVLRVDDRGVGKTTGKQSLESTTSYDYAKDVICGIHYLKTRPEINSEEIGLIGHSEGGLIASIVGAEFRGLSFIVSLSGIGVSGKRIALDQIKVNIEGKINQASRDSILVFQNRAFERIINHADDLIAQEMIIDAFYNGWIDRQDTTVKKYFGIDINSDSICLDKEDFIQSYKPLITPWFRFFLNYQPEKYLSNIKSPFLAINGNKDKQVLADLNLNGFKKSFDNAGKLNYSIRSYPGLNHFFQHCETGYLEEVETIDETFSKDVLRDVTKWIKEQLKNRNNIP